MFEVNVISEIGKRSAMEDAYIFIDDARGIFGGVYDGHNGAYAGEHAKEHLYKIFFRELEQGQKPEAAFVRAYEETSQELRTQTSGTTAVTFFIKGDVLYYANAGDGRLLVISRRGIQQLSVDHRVDNQEELQRIRKSGGAIHTPYVFKGAQGLMPTRSIGDEYFKDVGIIATPSVGQYQLQEEDKWIIAGTDGLFDVMESEEVAELVLAHNTASSAAEALRVEVLVRRAGTDNVTCILLHRAGAME